MTNLPPHTHGPDEAPSAAESPAPFARPIAAENAASAIPTEPLLLTGITRAAAGLDLLIFCGAIAALIGLVYGCSRGLEWLMGPPPATEPADEQGAAELVASLVLGVIAVALIVWINRARGLRLAGLGLTLEHWAANVPLGFATAAASWGVFVLSALATMAAWPGAAAEWQKNTDNLMKAIPPMRPALLAAMMLFVGIWEETVFRGFVLPRLRRLTGAWWLAVVLSSAIFAVLHLNMQVALMAIPLFLIAALWSLITIWRRSLLPVVLGHFLWNLGQLLALEYQRSHGR